MRPTVGCPVGVDPAKIRIVPEGLDTTFWDPAKYSAVNLSALNLRQATGPEGGANSSVPTGMAAAAGTPSKPYGELAVPVPVAALLVLLGCCALTSVSEKRVAPTVLVSSGTSKVPLHRTSVLHVSCDAEQMVMTVQVRRLNLMHGLLPSC
jgi:hypothetical protein